MRLRVRFLPASLVVAALISAVGACTSSSPTADPPATAPTTEAAESTATYTVVAGDALSSIASRYGISLDELIATNDWPDGQAHLIVPGDSIRLPSNAVTRQASTTTPLQAGPTTDRPGGPAATTSAAGDTATVGHYVALGTQYGGPSVGDKTLPVIPPLVDGVYEADAIALDSPDAPVTFTLYQVLYGDACRAVHGTDEDACLADHGIGEGSATVPFDMASGSVAVVTPMSIEAYSIDIAELQRLLAGLSPSADAPAAFQYTPWPFRVTVRDGVVVAADQHFVS